MKCTNCEKINKTVMIWVQSYSKYYYDFYCSKCLLHYEGIDSLKEKKGMISIIDNGL